MSNSLMKRTGCETLFKCSVGTYEQVANIKCLRIGVSSLKLRVQLNPINCVLVALKIRNKISCCS